LDIETTTHNRIEFNSRLRRTVSNIRAAIEVDECTFSEMLGIGRDHYSRIVQGAEDYSIINLDSLSKAIELDIDLLYSGKIDYAALAKQFRGDFALPERYSLPEQRIGRIRALKSIHCFLGSMYSFDYADGVFRRLQIKNIHLQNSSDFVGIWAVANVLAELKRDGLAAEIFQALGTMTTAVDNKIDAAYSTLPNAKQLYRAVFEQYAEFFDRAYRYKLLRLTDRGCTMSVSLNDETPDRLKTSHFGNKQTCLFLQGVFSSFLRCTDNRFATVLESECMHEGGSRCVYHLRWN
jgi:hypothetical protein